jgi:excinuclease UvrABC helicase subunit UvrB
MSDAMRTSIQQTVDRRGRQEAFNLEHGITPTTIKKALPTMGIEANELLAGTAGKGAAGGRRFVGGFSGQTGKDKTEAGLVKKYDLGAGAWGSSDDTLSRVSQPTWADVADLVLSGESATGNIQSTGDGSEDSDVVGVRSHDLDHLIGRLQKEMKMAASRLEFERAAQLRDRIFQLENEG